MWSLFLCLLTLNYCDAKLQLASKSSASKNKDWTIWIKKIESQKGIYLGLGTWFRVGVLMCLVAILTIKLVVLEWKRALKNYKNIVTIFVDEESSFKAEANRWMGPGARKSHKSAKMFYINCAEKEGKKLCKKYKQNPKPTTMQYWREGLFYKEFHREETPKAGFISSRLSERLW